MTLRRTASRATQYLFTFTLAMIFVTSVLQRQFGTYVDKDFDFDAYFLAARLVHDNPQANLYTIALTGNSQPKQASRDAAILDQARQLNIKLVYPYLYPPLLADLLSPFPVSERVAARAWGVCNLLFLMAGVTLIASTLGAAAISPEFLLIAAGCYCFFPVVEAIGLGQISIAMMALLAASVFSFQRHLYVLSAVAMAFATALKVTPLMFVPVFILWNQRRWLTVYGVSLASLVLGMGLFNGWHTLADSLRVIATMGAKMPPFQNKCIGALVEWLSYWRFFDSDPSPAIPGTLALTAKIASLAFYGLCLALVWRSRRVVDGRRRVTIFAVFAIVNLLTAPMSWRHGYSMALVPLGLLWGQALGEERLSWRTVLLAVTSLSLGTVLFDLVAGLHQLPPFVRIAFAGVSVVSSAMLCLDVLSRDISGPEPSQPRVSETSAGPAPAHRTLRTAE